MGRVQQWHGWVLDCFNLWQLQAAGWPEGPVHTASARQCCTTTRLPASQPCAGLAAGPAAGTCMLRAMRWRHQAKPSALCAFQSYSGLPHSWPVALKASGGTPLQQEQGRAGHRRRVGGGGRPGGRRGLDGRPCHTAQWPHVASQPAAALRPPYLMYHSAPYRARWAGLRQAASVIPGLQHLRLLQHAP